MDFRARNIALLNARPETPPVFRNGVPILGRALIVLSLSILFLSSCASGFYLKRPIYKSDRLYIYTLSESDYPSEEDLRGTLKPVKPFPAGSAGALLNLFTHLRVERKGLLGASTYPVYYPAQLNEIAPVLTDVLEASRLNVRYVLVTRFDPYNTVLSKMRRNTLLFWSDGEQIHLVFGEIHTELVGDDFIEDEKWIEIDPVNLRRAPADTRLLDNNLYQFEKVGDFTHLTHIIIPVEKFLAVKADPRFSRTELPPERVSDQKGEADVAERLKKLQKLREDGLINQAEYEEQKRRILSDL